MSAPAEAATTAAKAGLERGIDWTGAFWVASGVPPLVLFSIGAVAATVGKLSWVIWMASIAMGFIQSFTYAEIAGLFPNKAGGTSIYGAIAWVRYGKLIAPISVWCNWFAWSPVQATGSALAAGYILTGLFAPDALVNTWQMTLLDLGIDQDRPEPAHQLDVLVWAPSSCWRSSSSRTAAFCARRTPPRSSGSRR
jgi:amino acid transporter